MDPLSEQLDSIREQIKEAEQGFLSASAAGDQSVAGYWHCKAKQLNDTQLRLLDKLPVLSGNAPHFSDPTYRIIGGCPPLASPPPLASLKEYLVTKPQGLSFPMSPRCYAELRYCDLAGMFTEGTPDMYCAVLERRIQLVLHPPEVGVMEFSFIPFWNAMIHEPMNVYMQGKVAFSFDRNTNYDTQTVAQLPDYVGYVGSLYSLFRGEEKAPRGSGNPRQELLRRLVWVYKTLPYLLAYFATGKNVTFGALYHEGGKVQFRDIVTLDLNSFPGRVQCQLVLFNMSRVLVALCDLCTAADEISDIYPVQDADPERGGKSVTLCGHTVIKGYLDLEKAKKVWDVYSLLKDCPNAERCRTRKRKRGSDIDGSKLHCLRFSPRVSVTHQPRTERELVRALLHVSTALVFAHDKGIMHRDVSWTNVGLDVDANQWILLDWDEASTSPSGRASLCCAYHAPETSGKKSHNVSVDVWGLGWLIHTSKVEPSEELEALRKRCMELEPKCRPENSF